MIEQKLIQKFTQLLIEAGASADMAASCAANVLGRYHQNNLPYHNLEHVAATLAFVDKWAVDTNDVQTVQLALWFHDVIYDSTAKDNERLSTEMAVQWLTKLSLPPSQIDQVAALIELTQFHRPDPNAVYQQDDGILVCDADLAILAAPADKYDTYAGAIRQEYSWVPAAAFNAGRKQVLERFLAADTLFRLPAFARQAEPAARSNLRRELARLA